MKNTTLEQQCKKVSLLSNVSDRTQTNILNNIIAAVQCSISHMERRYTQLQQIAENHFDVYIRMKAEENLVPQSKMIAIARELIDRTNKLYKASKYEKISEAVVQRYLEELDVLNFMDYEVTKKFSPFIYDNFDAQVIQMPIAV